MKKDKIKAFVESFPIKDFTESDCVAELLKMYKDLTK